MPASVTLASGEIKSVKLAGRRGWGGRRLKKKKVREQLLVLKLNAQVFPSGFLGALSTLKGLGE